MKKTLKADMPNDLNPPNPPNDSAAPVRRPELARRGFTALGLLAFNFFLIIPAIVYAAMLFALYVVSIIVFVLGIAVTSSSLAGVNQLVLDGPVRHVILQKTLPPAGEAEHHRGRLRIEIHSSGLHVSPEPSGQDDAIGNALVSVGSNDGESDSRTVGTLKGIGFILGGIALVLLSMVVTRFTWLGLKRYVKMNASMLRAPE